MMWGNYSFHGCLMRTFVLWVFILVCSAPLHASDVQIKIINQGTKSAYMVQAGAFVDEKAAEALKTKLINTFHQPVEIDHPYEKSFYIVQLGPIKDYSEAQNLQKQIAQATKVDKNNSTQKIPSELLSQKVWNLRNADIRAVIAEVSRVSGKNFLIDPRVQGKISLVSNAPMSDKELYQVFLSMLQVSGYAAIPTGKVIKIIPNIDAKTQSPDVLSQMKSPPRGDDMLVQVIQVHYVPAEQLVPVLRPLMPQWSSVSAYAPSNMLVLSGRASNIRQLADIIRQVDSSSNSDIDIVPLKHTLAMDIASTLKELVKNPVQGAGGMQQQPTLAVDDRGNAILLSGSKTERIRLRLLIHRLDKQGSTEANSNTQVIYLNYLRAEDIVPILAGIAQANFSGTVGTTIGTITRPALDSTNPASSMVNNNSSSGNIEPPAPAGAALNPAAAPNTNLAMNQNEGSTKPTVQIIAEPNTNSIIINAPATLIRTLRAVINQLDIKPAQLLIEALVAEVNERDFNSLGIEWGSITSPSEARESFRPGFAIINSKTSIDTFQAQIYALAEQNRANILSTPSVVVLDNRQAKILIGKQVSVASSSYPNNANATTTGSPYTTFDRVNVALHLYVRPQITRGQGIQLQIDQGNDTLDPSAVNADSTNPTFNISAIVTSVHVESGDIIVLGGLAQDSLGNNNTRVPLLGDIPGVGRLFQHNRANREKKVLMVFIRPCILRTERDTVGVSGGKYDYVRQTELNALRDQDFNPKNYATVLPPLSTAPLPRPFTRPPGPNVITK